MLVLFTALTVFNLFNGVYKVSGKIFFITVCIIFAYFIQSIKRLSKINISIEENKLEIHFFRFFQKPFIKYEGSLSDIEIIETSEDCIYFYQDRKKIYKLQNLKINRIFVEEDFEEMKQILKDNANYRVYLFLCKRI